MSQKKKLLLIIGGALAGLILLFVLLAQGGGSIKVNVIVLPEDSTITLDGKTIKAGNIRINKGEHKFTASRQHFGTITKTIHTDDFEDDPTIYLLPIPNTPEALDYLNKHPDIQMQREGAGAAAAVQTEQTLAEKYPILKDLPYITLDYRIDYSVEEENNIALQVTIYPVANSAENPEYFKEQVEEFKQYAIEFMESKKVDFKTTPVTYTTEEQ